MKYFTILSILTLSIFAMMCAAPKEVPPPTAKQLSPHQIKGYHAPMEMKVAWIPYKNLTLKKTKKHNWVVVEDDAGKESALPMIMITYPNSGDTVWVQMSTKNDLLGKLVKHSLMTQVPIKRPYEAYFEDTKCTSCHPSDVKVSFD